MDIDEVFDAARVTFHETEVNEYLMHYIEQFIEGTTDSAQVLTAIGFYAGVIYEQESNEESDDRVKASIKASDFLKMTQSITRSGEVAIVLNVED